MGLTNFGRLRFDVSIITLYNTRDLLVPLGGEIMSDNAVAAGLVMIETLNLPDVSEPGVPPAMTELTPGHVF